MRRVLPSGRSGVLDDGVPTTGANMRPLAYAPEENESTGDVDARIRSCYDADQEREGEGINRAAAEDVQRERRQKYRARSDQRAAQSLVERLVHHFFEGAAHTQFQIFTNSIKDNDRVVRREADDR